MKHVDGVNFDQINSTGMEGVDIQWETTQFWRENICMEVVALMSGDQGEESHQAYKEGNGSYERHVEYYFFYGLLWLLAQTLKLFSRDYNIV